MDVDANDVIDALAEQVAAQARQLALLRAQVTAYQRKLEEEQQVTRELPGQVIAA